MHTIRFYVPAKIFSSECVCPTYAHNTIFTDVLDLMKKNELEDVLLVGGGIIPKNDVDKLESLGVGKLFGPGTPVQTTIDYIKNWVNKNRR